jgi:hypothetical protein
MGNAQGFLTHLNAKAMYHMSPSNVFMALGSIPATSLLIWPRIMYQAGRLHFSLSIINSNVFLVTYNRIACVSEAESAQFEYHHNSTPYISRKI